MTNPITEREFIARYCPVRPSFGEILLIATCFSVCALGTYRCTQNENLWGNICCLAGFLYVLLICYATFHNFQKNKDYLLQITHSGELSLILRDLESAEVYSKNYLSLGQRYVFLSSNQPFRYSQIQHICYRSPQCEDDHASIEFKLHSKQTAVSILYDLNTQEFDELIRELELRGAALTWEYRE